MLSDGLASPNQFFYTLREEAREDALPARHVGYLWYVFGHKTRAWALYQKMGYGPVSLTMAKAIGQPA